MLEVLWPADWQSYGFLVGEAWDHDAQGQPRYQAFTMSNGRYYEHDQPMTIAEFRKLGRLK